MILNDGKGSRDYIPLVQLVIECYDIQNPGLTAETVVAIPVNRNPNCPVFRGAPYRISISEDFAVNAYILPVNATDADGVSREFSVKYMRSLLSWWNCG